MYKLTNFIIIGAGGVTSHLMGPLLRTFKPECVMLFDRDALEERNLDRQLFNKRHVGLNKAEALKRHHEAALNGMGRIEIVTDWFRSSEQLENLDMDRENAILVSCADNHTARCAVLAASDKLGIPAIVGGNEYFDSEANLYLPKWKGTGMDMRVRFPAMLTDTRGSPLHCQEEQEIHPQLAVANMDCAAKILKLAWMYANWRNQEISPSLLVYRLFTSLYENNHERTRETNPDSFC